jgi:hypothetical protein
MNLEKIKEDWKKDSVIDDILLDQASMKIPQLHYKYLTYHSDFSTLQKRKTQELKKLTHKKWLYYSGKADPEVYKDAPFQHKILKSDVKNWIEVDDDIQQMQMEVEYYNTIIHYLEEVLRQIHQMSFNIKNTITWRTFTGGL